MSSGYHDPRLAHDVRPVASVEPPVVAADAKRMVDVLITARGGSDPEDNRPPGNNNAQRVLFVLISCW